MKQLYVPLFCMNLLFSTCFGMEEPVEPRFELVKSPITCKVSELTSETIVTLKQKYPKLSAKIAVTAIASGGSCRYNFSFTGNSLAEKWLLESHDATLFPDYKKKDYKGLFFNFYCAISNREDQDRIKRILQEQDSRWPGFGHETFNPYYCYDPEAKGFLKL